MRSVYIDTNVFKFSATELQRYVSRPVSLKWGELDIETEVHDVVTMNPNEGIINNERLKKEAGLLKIVAEMAKNGDISIVLHHETLLESWGIPNLDSQSGKFYNAPYELIEGPIRYSRTIIHWNSDAKDDQLNFLSSIPDKRFKELQKMTGAFQGEKPICRNQLLDAWYLWCAEHNKCDYFLTLDFKLKRMLEKNSKWSNVVKIVCPSELIEKEKHNKGLKWKLKLWWLSK